MNNIKDIKQFDIIKFGRYPQNKIANRYIDKPIKWKVINIQNGEVILLSEKILDVKVFDSKLLNYANSEIREWLNNDFFNKAFNEEEKLSIVSSTIDDILYDKIYLLSKKEIEQYGLGLKQNLIKKGTSYAISSGLFVNKYPEINKCKINSTSCWYLRNDSKFSNFCYGCFVEYDGYIFVY